ISPSCAGSLSTSCAATTTRPLCAERSSAQAGPRIISSPSSPICDSPALRGEVGVAERDGGVGASQQTPGNRAAASSLRVPHPPLRVDRPARGGKRWLCAGGCEQIILQNQGYR